MPNEIRQHLLDSLQSLPSREAAKKHAIAKQFEPFFAETQEADMLREHPEFRQSLPTKALLDSRKDYLLQQVVNCEKSSPTEEARVELSALDNKLTSLINEALPHLLSEYEDTDDWLSLEVKKQKQVQTQLELRFVQLNESYNPDLLADQSQPWIAFKNIEDLFTKDIHRRHWQSMNSFCGQAKRQIKLFDEDLLVCTTFAKTYRNQSKNLSAFLKDSFLVLYYKNPVSRKLQAMLITIDDAIPLQALCSKKQGIWIASTEDTQYAGNVPESILHEASYQRLREQIRFFNGEFDALVHNTNTLLWLCENTKEKLEFFESDLLPYKPHASKAFATLRSNLLQNDKEHYQYVKAHAFEDLSNLAWHTSEEKTKEYQSVAKALLFMNSHVSPCQLGIDQIRSTFAVPQRSLLFLKQHLSLIQTLHHFLDYLQAQTTHQFMMNPPAEFGECLEYFIGMSMDDFRQKEAIRCSFNQSLHTINWELATLAALLLLSKHPYVKDNPVIAAYLLSRAKKTSYTSVLLKLVHSTTLSDSMLQAILKNPACNTLVLTALGRKESLLNETLTLGSASPSTKAKNRFFNPNHSPSTKPQSTALTSESVNPMI